MSYEINTEVERTVSLTLAGLPVTNILPAGINVSYKKAGQSSFQTLAMTTLDWLNLGDGYYTLKFAPTLNDTLGTFVYKATGVGFDSLVFDQYNVVDPTLTGEQQAYFQDNPSERTVFLSLAGTPSPSIAFGSVTCQIKKSGQANFSAKVITNDNWIDLGSGYYTLKFSADDLSRVGNFVYKLSGAGFDNFVYDEFVILAAEDITVKDKCVVKAQFIGLGGESATQIRVTARMVAFPAKSKGRIVSGDTVFTFLDSKGNCELTLLRGATVLIEVPRAAVRNQIIVPDTPTANLIDLMPPFAVDFTV